MLLIGLVFAGLFQVSRLYAAREILHHASARGARARTVGFSRSMIEKSIMVGGIANAGGIREPQVTGQYDDLLDWLQTERSGAVWDLVLQKQPVSEKHRVERSRIPDFLDSIDVPYGRAVLDYDDWDTLDFDARASAPSPELVRVTVDQDYPLRVPAHRTFVLRDDWPLHGEATLENHYEAYMIDEGLR